MALDEDLYEWALTRPWWQQQALRRLAAGQPLGLSDFEAIGMALLDSPPRTPEGGWLGEGLRPAATRGAAVRLRAVRDVANVNALVDDQTLTFARSELTVVYGDNASGKSGYARVLKHSVRARHREDILPDIFEGFREESKAVTEYEVGDSVAQAQLGDEDATLRKVAFYDEKCGENYVTMEADVTYRPSGLTLLDALIGVCDGVRRALDERLAANAARSATLPALPDSTAAAAFLRRMGEFTTDEDIAIACSFDARAEADLEKVIADESRLRVSDPTREQRRLSRVAAALDSLANNLTTVRLALGGDAEMRLRGLLSDASQKRAAAEMASSATFDAEPLPGVGTHTWRALWEAARRFSESTAYPDQTFPVADGDARCPLCQQVLEAEAADRLHRFHRFMADDTEQQATAAEAKLRTALHDVGAVTTLTPPVAVHLETVRSALLDLADRVSAALEVYGERSSTLAALVHDPNAEPPAEPATETIVAGVTAAAQDMRRQAEAVDATAFEESLRDTVERRQSLEAQRALAAARGKVLAERDRRRERARLNLARRETDTRAITRQSTELTRKYVTASVQDRFSRESDRLGVERVTLQDTGGHKGHLKHRPAFLGAVMRADLPRVLSEGEQTALGLAGFFTEAYFDETNSALVLDDPVTSLDHLRRDKVARRLAEFARDRQVIVFTHDSAFVTELRRAAAEKDVTFTERAVERRLTDDAPGMCVDTHPWSVRDTKRRLGSLRNDLARIKREQSSWDRETYERETALWAGRLSETWERIISMEIANSLVDRGTLEVRVRMMKLVARITPEDEKELQESYSRCSQWAPRHDKDQSLGYVAPTVDKLEAELDLVTAWYDRVRKYRE